MSETYDTFRDINSPMDQPKVQVSSDDRGANNPDLKLVVRLFTQAKQVRKQYDHEWDKWLKWYEGKQWDWRRPSYKASPSMNIIRAAVQTVLPIMTDTSPSFEIAPQQPSDYQFADTVTKMVDVWWARRNMQMVLTTCVLDSLIFPIGCMKVVWNDDIEGIGDIDCTRVDPRNIYVDPDATDFTDAKYVIEEKWVAEPELKLKFPDRARYITGARTATDPKSKPENKTLSGEVTLQSPIDQDIPLQTQGDADKNTSGTAGQYKSIRVMECWLRDETLDEQEIANKDGETKKIYKRKYPRGKVITIIPDSQVLLQSVDNPYADGKFPYVRFVDTVQPGMFWGQGEVEPIIETQKMINKVGATITDWCNRMTNNVWILDDDSGVNPAMLTNQVGLIISKRRGTEVKRDPAPNLPGEVFEFYNLLMRLIDQQSGIHDTSRGRTPNGVTAASAIQSLQDADQTRIRLKERNLQASLTQLGYMVVSRMLQFYTTPRVVRITGSGEWPDFYEVFFSREELKEQGSDYPGQFPDQQEMIPQRPGYISNSRQYQFSPSTRQYVAVTDWQQTSASKGEFDVEVTAGTSLPFMKQRRSNLAFQLFQAKAIDQEALLEAVEFPDSDAIMRRMNKAAQAAQSSALLPGQQPVGQGAYTDINGQVGPQL
jgi:hypothetical protein